MITRLREIISKFERFEIRHLNIGLEIKIPFSHNLLTEGMRYIEKKYPELTDLKYDEEEDKITFTNLLEEKENRLYFRIQDSRFIDFTINPLLSDNLESLLSEFCDVVENGFRIFNLNIELFKLEIVTRAFWNGNHYKLFNKTFIDNKFFNSLYSQDQDMVIDNNLSFRGFLGQNRLFVIKFLSNVDPSEILNNKFTSSQLDILCGIGQIRGFNDDSNLIKVLTDHMVISFDFFVNKFCQNVLTPINENISLLEKEKER